MRGGEARDGQGRRASVSGRARKARRCRLPGQVDTRTSAAAFIADHRVAANSGRSCGAGSANAQGETERCPHDRPGHQRPRGLGELKPRSQPKRRRTRPESEPVLTQRGTEGAGASPPPWAAQHQEDQRREQSTPHLHGGRVGPRPAPCVVAAGAIDAPAVSKLTTAVSDRRQPCRAGAKPR